MLIRGSVGYIDVIPYLGTFCNLFLCSRMILAEMHTHSIVLKVGLIISHGKSRAVAVAVGRETVK